MLVMVYATLAR